MGIELPHFEICDDETAAKFRSMTVAEKIQLMGDLNEAARAREAERILDEHPKWTDEQVQSEIARRMLSEDEAYFK